MASYELPEINDEAQEHKNSITAVFDSVAEGYDHPALRWFPFAADAVVDLLQIKPGSKLLDVATGTGVVAVSAAQYCKSTGRVMAIDLSEKMMGQAIAKARHLGFNNIDFFQMDAENLEFKKDYFDYVICNFGLFFLPNMQKALQEWSRVCKPGARIAFTSFTETAFQPMMKLLIDQLQEFGAEFDGQTFSSQRLVEKQVCRKLLDDAGFKNIDIKQKQCGYHLLSVDDWWSILWNTGARDFLHKLSEDKLEPFKQYHLASIQELFTEDGLWLDVEVNISMASV